MEENKKNLGFILLVLLSWFFLPDLAAQDEIKLKEDFLEAESYFLFEEYKDALPLYQKILRFDTENDNLNYKIGICYLNDPYQKAKSISYLEKAVKNINTKYKENTFKEKQAPPESYYYLGNAYRINNYLDEAIKTYKKFKEILDPLVYDVALVDKQIKSCEIAKDVESRPLFIVKNNLGNDINSHFAEINPIISGDENTLVFTKKLQFYDAVFYSVKQNGAWSYPINLTPSFEMDGNSYCTGLSWNGDEIFVYRSDNFDGNLYVSHRTGDKWSKLQKLNDNINTKYWESHASLSPDGKTLYFTSNRKEGYGGLDIYISHRTSKENWGQPINLGPIINSEYNEESPFISGDGKTLYFSSQGHYNMGGYDVFYSSLLSDDNWAKPLNAGYPINSTSDDLFFVPVKGGEYAYYSIFEEDGKGLDDIFKLEIFSDLHPRKFILKGIVKKDITFTDLNYKDLTIKLIDRKTNKTIDESKINADGTYTLNAQSGEFDLIINGKNITQSKEFLKIPLTNPTNEFKHETVLYPSSKDTDLEYTEIGTQTFPKLELSDEYLEVTDGKPIAIKLDVDKNTFLSTEVFVNDSLTKKESFEINKKRFIYYYRPEEGKNLIQFTLEDKSGNKNLKQIVINYIVSPQPESLAETDTISDKEKNYLEEYKYLSDLATGNLKKYLESIDIEELNLKSSVDIYNHLIKQLPGSNFTQAEIDELFIHYLSQKNIDNFKDELNNYSPDKLSGFIKSLNLDSANIHFPESLIDYLLQNVNSETFDINELDYSLTKVSAQNNNSVNNFLKILNAHADKNLEYTLLKLKSNSVNFSDPYQIIKSLMSDKETDQYQIDDIHDLLKKSAGNFDVDFLYQSMLFLSDGNLSKTLIDLNIYNENIKTSKDLIQYLWIKSSKNGYQVQDVINLAEKIRADSRKAVELFRELLASRATGNLKAFLQTIDFEKNNISTFTDLLNYLIFNSKFQNYNRETVYKLLLDIIDIQNVDEFIKMLKKYAAPEIFKALVDIDLLQYTSPYEVIQYLIANTEKYSYTEQDILNLLLKLVLAKGYNQDDSQLRMQELQKLKQKKLVTTFIAANGILLILIILIIIRKKRKKDK